MYPGKQLYMHCCCCKPWVTSGPVTLHLNLFELLLDHRLHLFQVDKDLRVMLVKPEAPQPKTVAVTVWQRAIPQFNIHHLDDVTVGRSRYFTAFLLHLSSHVHHAPTTQSWAESAADFVTSH